MLNIIIGRISQGKTNRIISSIGERIKNKQKSVLIVPQSSTFNFEKRICSQLNLQGFIDVEVCSFNRLASDIVNFCGAREKCFLDDSAKAMLLRACIVKEKENLSILKNASMRKGFVQLCLSLISNLQNCGYSPADLKDAAKKLDDEILRQKLIDISVIFSRYMQILSSGYTDNIDRLNSARELIPYYTPLSQAKVFIDGFDLFTNQLFSFIAALAHVCDVDIALSSAMDKSDKRAYEFHQQTLNKLIKLAHDEGINYIITPAIEHKTDKAPKIKFLEDNFYATNSKAFEGDDDSISINVYKSVYDELTSVSLDISNKVRSGARYKDFCVLCGNIDSYSSAVKSIFTRYNIPVFTDNQHDITTHPVARFLFSALEACVFAFSPKSVINYVLSRLTPLSDDEADRFTLFINTYGVLGYELENGLSYLRGTEEEQADFDLLRERVITPLKEFSLNLLQGETAKDKSKACYNFFENLGIFDKVNSMVDAYEELGCFDLSDVSAQLWNITMDLLGSISSLMGSTPLTTDEFRLTLLEGFNFSPASTIPSVIDCVTFGDLTSGKEGNFKHVYLLGANEGAIPALVTPGGLLTSRESDILLDNGIDLAHSIESEDARTRYQTYAAFCLAKESLHICATTTTVSGGTARPSTILKRFAYLNLAKIQNVTADYTSLSFSNPVTAKQLMLAAALDKGATDKAEAVLEILKKHAPKEFDLLSYTNNASASILQKTALSLFAGNTTSTISRLETFASCPLSHFITYGLSPAMPQEYLTNAQDVGNLLHETLEDFVSEYASAGFSLDENKCNQLVEKSFNARIPEVHFGTMLSSSRQRVLNSNLLNLTKRCALAIREDIGVFTPIGEEISFGYGKSAPIEIATDYGTIYLRGKIDRADTLDRGGQVLVRIVDYKSGSKKFDVKNIASGEDIQLMIYMRALLSLLGENAYPAQAYLMRIDPENNGALRSGINALNEKAAGMKNVSDDAFNEYLDLAYQAAKASVEGMLSGNIKASESVKNCEYCQYKSICSAICEKDFSFLGKEDEEDNEMD